MPNNCSDKQIKILESIHNLKSKMKHNKTFKLCLVLFFISMSITRVESNSKKRNQKKSLKHHHPFEAQYIYWNSNLLAKSLYYSDVSLVGQDTIEKVS